MARKQGSYSESWRVGQWAVVEVLKHLGMEWTFNVVQNSRGAEVLDYMRVHMVGLTAAYENPTNIQVYLRKKDGMWFPVVAEVARIKHKDWEAITMEHFEFRFMYRGEYPSDFIYLRPISRDERHVGFNWDLDKCFEAIDESVSTAVDLDELQEEARKLLALLEDRQTGLISWNMWLHLRAQNLRAMLKGV